MGSKGADKPKIDLSKPVRSHILLYVCCLCAFVSSGAGELHVQSLIRGLVQTTSILSGSSVLTHAFGSLSHTESTFYALVLNELSRAFTLNAEMQVPLFPTNPPEVRVADTTPAAFSGDLLTLGIFEEALDTSGNPPLRPSRAPHCPLTHM